jgi:hypothetical protein
MSTVPTITPGLAGSADHSRLSGELPSKGADGQGRLALFQRDRTQVLEGIGQPGRVKLVPQFHDFICRLIDHSSTIDDIYQPSRQFLRMLGQRDQPDGDDRGLA